MSVIIQAASKSELRQAIDRILCEPIPLRGAGRTTQSVELYALAKLLLGLRTPPLHFPISIEHRDRPDFAVRTPYGFFGIEHTEAVPPNVAKSDALRNQRNIGPEIYSISHATPDEPARTTEELVEDILANEMGDGWVGDQAEREWANAMLSVAIDKVGKVQLAGFEHFDDTWLLIYDNWPIPPLDHKHKLAAANMLLAKLHEAAAFRYLGEVHIVDDATLLSLFHNQDPRLVSLR